MKVTEQHVEARKNQILDAAWECFAELGYHQTTMAAIAAAAGLSAGALYLYFENKDALLMAIGERSRSISREIVAAARAESTDPLTALNAVGRTMLAVFSDPRFAEATRVNIEIWPELLRNEPLADGLRKDLSFWKGAVDAFLQEAQAAGELRADVDTRAVTLLLIAAWEGLRHYRIIDEEFSQDVLLYGMRSLLTDKGQEEMDRAVAAAGELLAGGPPNLMPHRHDAGDTEGSA